MCYHVSVHSPKDKLTKRFKARIQDDELFSNPNFHVSGFSHRKLPVITEEQPDLIQGYNWGLIPFFMKDIASAKQSRIHCLNAKSETIFEKPSFRAPIMKRRCLVLVDGFMEWRDVNKNKYPHYIYLKEKEPFALGGIYDKWVDKETGENFNTFSIITTEANPMMAAIHNSKLRMPLILDRTVEQAWLKENNTKEDLINYMQPFDENKMAFNTISKLITSRKENTNVEKVLEPFEYHELN